MFSEPYAGHSLFGSLPSLTGPRRQRTDVHGLPPMRDPGLSVNDGAHDVYLSDPIGLRYVMAHEMHLLGHHRLDGSAR